MTKTLDCIMSHNVLAISVVSYQDSLGVVQAGDPQTQRTTEVKCSRLSHSSCVVSHSCRLQEAACTCIMHRGTVALGPCIVVFAV